MAEWAGHTAGTRPLLVRVTQRIHCKDEAECGAAAGRVVQQGLAPPLAGEIWAKSNVTNFQND
jgi:hypothetical protein